MTASGPRVVRVIPNGPVMVQGPVRIELPDGSVVDIRSLHGGHLRVPAQPDISAVRHQPSAALPAPDASAQRSA